MNDDAYVHYLLFVRTDGGEKSHTSNSHGTIRRSCKFSRFLHVMAVSCSLASSTSRLSMYYNVLQTTEMVGEPYNGTLNKLETSRLPIPESSSFFL